MERTMPKAAVIIAHGELEVTSQVREAVARADLIVAADGGAASAVAQGWWPHLLVGDLDSAPAEVEAAVLAHGGRIVRYPARKDETDTELALRAALEGGAEEVFLIGAAGDRLDHTLANVLLLALPEAAGVRLTILAGKQRLFLIRDRAEICGRPGDLLSLLPIGGDASGIWTTGLEYPLRGEALPFGTPRGVSNVLSEACATVRLEKGLLLAIVTEM
jgi:thiamine pyrophosphokinase